MAPRGIAVFDWTEAKETALRELYAKGAPASRIAIEIGAPTRNTVIGKIARLGLSRLKPAKADKPKPAAPALKPPAKQNLHAGNIARKAARKAEERKALPPNTPENQEARREHFQAVADKALEKFDAAVPVASEPVRFLDRGHFQCAMPQPGWDDAPVDEKMVCGQPVQAGTSWCPRCLAVVSATPKFAAFKHRRLVGEVAA